MSHQTPLQELGRKRQNPLAQNTNFFKLGDTVCECTDDATCMDYVDLDINPAKTLVSFTWEGQTILCTNVLTSNTAALKDAIEQALLPYEVGVYVEVNPFDGSDNVRLSHYGAGAITQLQFSDTSTANLTRSCTVALFCTFFGSAVGTVTPLNLTLVNGTTATVTVAGGPYAWTGTPATDATTASSLRTALYNALLAGGYIQDDQNTDLTVAVNDADETFDIVLPYLLNVTAIDVNGQVLTKGTCKDDFSYSI